MSTLYHNLIVDPQIQSAKQQILQAIFAHQHHLTTIRPPQDKKKQTYAASLRQMESLRGLPLFYPYLGSGFGKGALVELADGSVKYDLIAGIGVHYGHMHPRIIEAHLDASLSNLVMQGNLMQNAESEQLLELLTRSSGLPHCFLSSSGAMACENALKICFHHRPFASRILAFERCFAGRTWALSQLTDQPAYRVGLPLNVAVDYLPFYDWKLGEKSTQHTLERLQTYLKRYPNQHACMCVELVQGEGGYYAGEANFFTSLMRLLKEHEIPIWIDEVQTFGRTDHLFAFQHFKLDPLVDLVTVGKLLHTCALLYQSHLTPKPGLLSQTYTASTAMIHVAIAILQSLLEEGILGDKGKNMQIRNQFLSHFETLAKNNPGTFQGPFGLGTMLAFTPYQGDKKQVMAFLHRLFEAGVIAFYCGREPQRVRFLPPVGGMSLEDVDIIMEIVKDHL